MIFNLFLFFFIKGFGNIVVIVRIFFGSFYFQSEDIKKYGRCDNEFFGFSEKRRERLRD